MSFRQIRPFPRAVVEVCGPRGQEPGVLKDLQLQLDRIPKDVEWLTVDNDTPSNSEWDLLGSHFTSVKDLHIDAGWNEKWNDEKLPLHWPLDRLVISSSIADVCRSPWIQEGRVRHLVLALTSGLGFEGPTVEELQQAHDEKIKSEEKKAQKLEGGKITITYIPDLVHEWMKEKYSGIDQEQETKKEMEEMEPKVEAKTEETELKQTTAPFFATLFH
ncbi:MAG: hypothetical protein MMC33_000853 [Icmadophila ericetorum]|nr:hypothetical protein [Icmadophila ericetorum]